MAGPMILRAETRVDLVALGERLVERDFWLDFEEISSTGSTLLCPFGKPGRRGRWLGRDSTPSSHPYLLRVRNVVSWELTHPGGYPFSQPLDRIVDDTSSEFRLLGRARSICRVSVTAIDVELVEESASPAR